MEIFVRDDVVHIGVDECGTPVEALSYYLVAEAADGSRWAHFKAWANVTREYDEAGGEHYFARDWDGVGAAAAEALRVKVAAHVAAGGTLDLDVAWAEIDPAYGSAAYQGLDAVGYFRARERHEARLAGEAVAFDEPGDALFV
jgi:hypothetical protein